MERNFRRQWSDTQNVSFENAQNTPLGFISVSDKIMTNMTSQTALRFEDDFLAIKKELQKYTYIFNIAFVTFKSNNKVLSESSFEKSFQFMPRLL